MQAGEVKNMWVLEAVRHYKALRAIRMAQEGRYWDFEPTILRVRLRQAYCILVVHKWLHGMGQDAEGHSYAYKECIRCGIRWMNCMECNAAWVPED
jgi:hypothetical protein